MEYAIIAYNDDSNVKLGFGLVCTHRKRKKGHVFIEWMKWDNNTSEYILYDNHLPVECHHKTAIASRGYLKNGMLEKKMIEEVFENKYCQERWTKNEMLLQMMHFLSPLQQKEYRPIVVIEDDNNTCSVCMDENPKNIICSNCNVIVCTDCFRSTMKTRMDLNENIQRVQKCLAPNCSGLQSESLQLITSNDLEVYSLRLAKI